MRNRAGLYFYHPHTHEATATQVYRGMAGAIIVGDDEEKALELPSGDFEIPIVLQDRTFNDDNQLVYGGGMHAQMVGFKATGFFSSTEGPITPSTWRAAPIGCGF